jgi:hypothetical protein
VLAWPIERVVIAHGVLPTADGAAFVRRAFAWLLGRDPAPALGLSDADIDAELLAYNAERPDRSSG